MNIKRLFLLAAVLVPMVAIAQMKIATVDVQSVFADMPESKAASEQLEKATQQYEAEYKMMQTDFNGKYAAYQSIAANNDVPATIRDRRVREIQDSDREIEIFLENSRTSLAAMKQELETPIYAKINAAIKQVGDEGRYTYIIDVSKTPLVYSGNGAIDVTLQVKKVLGLSH